MFEEHETIGSIVASHPSTARVFEQRGVDYCCGGGRTLAQAAQGRGLQPAELLRELEQAAQGRGSDGVKASDLGLGALCEHIIERHHSYLRSELPRLEQLVSKVAQVHGEKDPGLNRVKLTFIALREELEQHMEKEEMILFPLVEALEEGQAGSFHCGSVQNPIARMIMEHENAGEALQQLRELTKDYEAPEWACNTYRAMLSALAELERDLHEHIHKENNILFPRAVEREAELLG